MDKTGTPLIKPLQKPTGVVTPSPQTTPQTHKVPSPSNGGLTHEFSIPLRKTEIRSERRKQTTPGATTSPPGSATSDPQKVTSTPSTPSTPTLHPAFSNPGFTPRVITAKPRKLHKSPIFPKVDPPVKAADEKNPETASSTQMQEIEEKKETPGVGRRKEEAGHVQTILDIAEMSLCESTTTSSGYSSTPATKERKFIGPLLPPQFRSPPLSPAPQPFSFMSPTTKSPKVARVQPQRHSPQPPNVKPIARVLPSPQVSSPRELTAEALVSGPEELVESKKEDEKSDESPKNKDEEKKEKEGSDSGGSPQPSTPSSEPHVNSTSQWKVTGLVYGPTLPNDYDTTAHGWTVTPMKLPSEEQSSTGFKTKKQKKKKRYRKHSTEYDYDTDGESSEGEGDKRNGDRLTEKAPRKRHDSEELRRTKHRDRECSLTPERKPHKASHDGKYRKHTRHHPEYFDSREQRERKQRHYSDFDDRHSRKHYHRRRPSSSDSEGEYHRRHKLPARDHISSRHTNLKPYYHGNRYHLSDLSFREARREGRFPADRRRSEGFRRQQNRFNRRSPERRGREKPYHYHHRDQERRRDVERDRHWSGKHRKNSDGEYERSGRKRTHSYRDRSPSPDCRRHEDCSKRHKMEAACDSHRERNERKRSPGELWLQLWLFPGLLTCTKPYLKHTALLFCCVVPEVKWDDPGRPATSHSHKWDGSQRSETVQHLTSHAHGKLGDIGKLVHPSALLSTSILPGRIPSASS